MVLRMSFLKICIHAYCLEIYVMYIVLLLVMLIVEISIINMWFYKPNHLTGIQFSKTYDTNKVCNNHENESQDKALSQTMLGSFGEFGMQLTMRVFMDDVGCYVGGVHQCL